jgi:hypothetical protein
MLYPQIPSGLRDRIAADLKIDLKLVAVSLSEKPSDETRYSKLQLVTDYLERESLIGDLETPGLFIRGVLPMRWGPLRADDAVFFSAVTETTVVALGGSLMHVIGAPGASQTSAHSALYGLLGAIKRSEKFDRQANIRLTDSDHLDPTMNGLLSAYIAAERMSGPPQTLEFLARSLLQGEIEGKVVILGSPLYVALAD